jgi:dynein heavy chain
MQRPAEMIWASPKCMGEGPSRRSGHSMSIIGDFCYIFGGNDFRRPPGPNNELFKLDMSSAEFYWSKIENNGKAPEPRSQHTCVVYNDTKILLFGGFRSSHIRYNDVWILDTTTDEWSQPHAGVTETKHDGEVVFKRQWPDVPMPRGAHSATLVGSQMYIFGGYGGAGFARRDFNDITVLDLDTWEWRSVETSGEIPEARSGHQGVSIKELMYVIGGWNSIEQFSDMYILDTNTNVWSKPVQQNSFGAPRWNFAAVSVFAVPYWKIFVFGGNSGNLSDGGPPQGEYLNDMCVYETGSNTWTHPKVLGDQPVPRGESPIAFDPKGARLLLFGGWANRWFGDVYTCKVADVVGPPYSVNTVEPNMGPITGGTPCIIKGLGFKSGGIMATIRFACMKGFVECPGDVLDDGTIKFNSPNFEKYGAQIIEGRVGVGGKSLSNSSINFNYFAVTSCNNTVMFGPGNINGCLANADNTLIIQGRDELNVNRTCGMDCWTMYVAKEIEKGGKMIFDPIKDFKYNIIDHSDGTYKIDFQYPSAGKFKVEIVFDGTFQGRAGNIRGSPFEVNVTDKGDAINNELNGPLMMEYVRKTTKETKEYSQKSLSALKKTIPKDEIDALIRVKEVLHNLETKKVGVELGVDSSKAALMYFKQKGGSMDKMIEQLNNSQQLWTDVNKQVPITSYSLVPLTKTWSSIVEEEIAQYNNAMGEKLKEFKKRSFWGDITDSEAKKSLAETVDFLKAEKDLLAKKKSLTETFEFPHLIKAAVDVADEMTQDIEEMTKLWQTNENLNKFIKSCDDYLWSEMNLDDLEDASKRQVKLVKQTHKCTRWSKAFRATDKTSKDFLNTVPLIQLLAAKSMRERHWTTLKTVTNNEFIAPYQDKNLQLGSILALKLHELGGDVEDICDQAVKELKIENTVIGLEERWLSIEWIMDPYKDTDVPLLKLGEEDFEALEADQLTVQGMLASRFVKQFEESVQSWQVKLANIADVFLLLTEIQRTWSYLEPLFIGSEEVKRELPEDAKRFAGIDDNVKKELKNCWTIKNTLTACNQNGLIKFLESNQAQLDICKKSLADFLDGRRRQFPRYYFTSEADLLDILSNGSQPHKILKHTSKVYLSTKTLVFDKKETTPETGRPYAATWISGVGVETVDFEPKVALEGKIEIYHQTILDAKKQTLFNCLLRSLKRYNDMPREKWIMHKKPEPNPEQVASDPSQILLLVVAVYYVQEVEDVFSGFADPSKCRDDLLTEYSNLQVLQLKELIKLTQSKLNKSDRTKVMVCITMDAHSRDIVIDLIRDNIRESSSFKWQSQLKHKWRVPAANATFKNRDPHLRGEVGQRIEVAICDAVLPYDYEYLGNGARLVITPLTDRIYVTATQALNLKMGCAPAGPAGTGKTESTKDLASALAKCVYVINCSPEMDYLGLGNIFKGLASSGSWGCFDEFNRLVPEVLSVCTVQFKAVCDGVKAESSRVVIESDDIAIDHTVGVFITMNPGYLGRSELPEGLKALFRPITVMVPDLVLICENMLMAEGFTEGKILASKFYGLYSLLRDLLSKQIHYDWGLRAVKSVLVVAGSFKRMEPDLLEEALLMRALRDFNTPKIVREDEVVFFGLLGDLFPGISPPRKVDEALEEQVLLACESLGKHPDDVFRLKVVQLEELLEIRHCVFVMGPPGCGKSSVWKTLAESRNIRGDKTTCKDINPKSIKTEELYGCISMATREWKDGLLSKTMRDLGEIPDEKPKWIILDGDLDANWIESMNSVMDDNKMLTLASNERIPLKAHMRLLFEIRDLRFATPATVSRAGILFISADDGKQWVSMIASWLLAFNGSKTDEESKTDPEKLEEVREKLKACFDKYVRVTLRWMKTHVEPVVTLQDMNFVQTLLYMLDVSLTDHIIDSATADAVEKTFVFCMLWSMGSSLTVTDDGTDHRKLFSDWWRSEWKSVKMPTQYTVYDYWYDPEANAFDLWSKSPFLSADMMEYESTTPMGDVTVPTPETCSVTYWMKLLVNNRRPVMLAGPSGTGKTQIVNGMVNLFDPQDFLSCTINFNFYTTSAVLLSTMSLPLVKKTGTNYGPPGQAKLVYFVDDLNLPETDPYDTQSAVAILRQQLEYEHIYDMSKLSIKNVQNTQLVACMNPTAGCFEINPRLQRWFATFAIGLPETMSLHTIYLTFLTGHLKNFDESIQNISKDLVKGAVSLHREVMNNFRKTAQNFHYEFNIRHISNVFQGLLVSAPDQFTNPEKFVHLWLHESERVYGDRLVSYEDLSKYNIIVQQQHKKVFPSFQVSRFYAAENADALVFCHFSENIQDKVYDMISSIGKLSKILEDALREYNDTNAAMDLVLFEDAMKHIARIVRVIMNTGGHALLVGVGGSGKQSLSRLSAFICAYNVSQIVISSSYSINDLKEDLKLMYNKAGIKEEGVMFLLTDSQITNERFLIFINDLLASGNIPDLFTPDEIDVIVNAVTNRVKEAGMIPDKTNCWDYFLNNIRKNLHVVLAFSPVGDAFRTRAKKFPAIVNCTSIDWFQPWPHEALYSVGKKFMAEVDLGDEATRAVVESFLPYSFTEVNKMANKFRKQERRHVYTTPKSYLELLKLYQQLLQQKRISADADIERLSNGLQKLQETAASVNQIEADLKISLEEADTKKTVSEGIAEVVSREKAIVEVETAKAQVKAKEVSIIQAEVMEKQRSTEEDLAKAEPLVESAMAALNTLDKKDLGEAKTMAKPPSGVDDVFAATMVLLAGVHPNVVVQKNGKVKDRSWDAAKKQLLGNIVEYIDFLKGIKTGVDERTIPKLNFIEVRPLIELEHFKPEIIMTKNKAAAGLCSFIVNIVMYYEVVTTVEPKRKALAEANLALEEANATLKIVMDHVATLEAKLATLTTELNHANSEKQDAMDSVERGQKKLDLAQRLTNALASENVRWGQNIVDMEADKLLLTGDVLLSSAFISYVGPFTKTFRDLLMVKVFTPFLKKGFQEAVGEENPIPMSDSADPVRILTNPAQVAVWAAAGLPADAVSIENGTIVVNSARWPLFIDPQLQGITWLKNKESSPDRALQVVRLGQGDLIRKLERALEDGTTILIENIAESIDAVLNPVIQRAVIRRGKKMYIKLGDTEIEFHKNFQLYLQTKLSNPHYPPEIQAECTLINFTVTASGLEDQILALVVRKERLDLALLSEDLVKQQNDFTIKMKELEDNILHKLATAEGDITEDVALIEGLETTKKIANEIAIKQDLAQKTQAEIKITSEKYRGVANRSSLLFFLMNDLNKIHTYYIYSLEAFSVVFYRGIDYVTAKKVAPVVEYDDDGNIKPPVEEASLEMTDEELDKRCIILTQSITDTVFNYIRRGLFEIDKLTVSTLLTLRISINDGLLAADEAAFLVEGKSSFDPGNMGPLHEWLPPALWPKIKALEGMKRFAQIGDNMQSDSDDWLKWFDNEMPEIAKLPGDYQKTLGSFDRLILLRAMRPDRVTTALKKYIENTMGGEYVYQKPFDMPACYAESSNQTPTFFVLFAGVDPTPWVESLAKTKGITLENGNFKNISMGQGQEKPAEAIVTSFAKKGGWVMLQNCHLMQSWVPTLERLLEVVQEDAHPEFRCFISAEPPPLASWKNMPESLMQGAVKVANEAPSDIKSNILRGWANFDDDRIKGCTKSNDFKGCLFSLCWFHSIVLGRRRFGQQGWSRKYSFNTGDLTICANVLQSYLQDNPIIPWDDLKYIFGEIMYGGHITDSWDRRTCNSYLSVLFNDKIFKEMEFGPGFKSPDAVAFNYSDYIEYVETKLPQDSPAMFGLHANAEIGYLTNWTGQIFETVQSLSGGGSGGGTESGGKSVVKELMDNFMKTLPPNFDMLAIMDVANPLLGEVSGPFVVVAIQECQRMNGLLTEIRRSLIELEKGMKGQLNMSQPMEDLIQAIGINQWPGRNPFAQCRWEGKAWPSMKNLASQFLNMLERITQLTTWSSDCVTPLCLWLPGLFNPTAYLTAVMQVTARKTGLPLDQMTTETYVSTYSKPEQCEAEPHDGAFIHGLYIEGARWPVGDEAGDPYDITGTMCSGHLVDGRLKELLPQLPVIYVKAVPVLSTWEPSAVGYLRRDPAIFECPIYITSFRGHTYVFLATLKTVESANKWVLTGTAILMQTDY